MEMTWINVIYIIWHLRPIKKLITCCIEIELCGRIFHSVSIVATEWTFWLWSDRFGNWVDILGMEYTHGNDFINVYLIWGLKSIKNWTYPLQLKTYPYAVGYIKICVIISICTRYFSMCIRGILIVTQGIICSFSIDSMFACMLQAK